MRIHALLQRAAGLTGERFVCENFQVAPRLRSANETESVDQLCNHGPFEDGGTVPYAYNEARLDGAIISSG